MRKSLYIIGVAAIIVSCSQTDTLREINSYETAIDFGDSYIGKKTKAVFGEITDSASLAKDGSTLKVWGWKNVKDVKTAVFTNQRVEFKSGSNQTTTKWVYTPLKFWDMSAKEYLFIAAAPDTALFTVGNDTLVSCSSIFNRVMALYNNDGNDLITKTNKKSKAVDFLVAEKVRKAPKGNAPDKDVQFTFSHILSKLTVKVQTTDNFNNTDNNYPQIKLTDLKIHLRGMCPDFKQKTVGELTPAATDGDTWSGSAMDSTVYTSYAVAGDIDSLLLKKDAQAIAEYLITPTATGTNPTKYNYYATVGYEVIFSATEKEHFLAESQLIPTLKSFEQNTSNILTIKIDPQAIYFDVKTVKTWDDGAEPELEIN